MHEILLISLPLIFNDAGIIEKNRPVESAVASEFIDEIAEQSGSDDESAKSAHRDEEIEISASQQHGYIYLVPKFLLRVPDF